MIDYRLAVDDEEYPIGFHDMLEDPELEEEEDYHEEEDYYDFPFWLCREAGISHIHFYEYGVRNEIAL